MKGIAIETIREKQSLEIYLSEIGKEGLLTPQDEITLAQEIRNFLEVYVVPQFLFYFV